MFWNFLKKNISFLNKREPEPLINILTRTSNRPGGFKKCFSSVRNQTYKNIRHIISYDNTEDLSYIRKYDVEFIRVYRREKLNRNSSDEEKYEPYNLYCNELLKEVNEGWIMFLDDDDMLAHQNVLKTLATYTSRFDEDTLFIWQAQFPDGTLIPPDYTFKDQTIKLQHIDTACFLFHSKYKNTASWDAYWAADFRFIKQLSDIIPKQVWIPSVLTKKNNFGDQGKRNDIEE